MRSHFYNTSLSGRPIPEEDTLGSASGSSSSSLDNDHSFAYPADLLGTSWGSYLFSGPPTAARSSRKVVINATPQPLKLPPISAPSLDQTSPKRSILRTPGVKEGGTAGGKVPLRLTARPDAHEAAAGEQECGQDQPHPLLRGLQSLANAVAGVKEKLSYSGVDTTPLATLCEGLASSQHELRQTLEHSRFGEDSGVGAGVLRLAFTCLEAALQRLAEQGEKLKEKADFLQKTGKQLNRTQKELLKEQQELQETVERASAHLSAEKVTTETC